MSENNQTIYEEFGIRIKEIRKSKNLTQKDLSSLMNVTQSTIVAIEKGQRRIPLNMINKFCEVFDMTYEELVNKDNSQINKSINNKHLTKYEVASELGFTNEEISVLQSGVKQIPRSFFEKFASYFDVDIENLNALSLEADGQHAVITTDDVIIERYKKWQYAIGYEHFTDEEIEQIIDYAKYLISKRNK